MYYERISSISELIGEEGILRLPSYLPRVFVLDDARRETVKTALELAMRGENVLIEGRAGKGKTALMFIILTQI